MRYRRYRSEIRLRQRLCDREACAQGADQGVLTMDTAVSPFSSKTVKVSSTSV